jgi:hypothetical protein
MTDWQKLVKKVLARDKCTFAQALKTASKEYKTQAAKTK